jgi:hypothetical protein
MMQLKEIKSIFYTTVTVEKSEKALLKSMHRNVLRNWLLSTFGIKANQH